MSFTYPSILRVTPCVVLLLTACAPAAVWPGGPLQGGAVQESNQAAPIVPDCSPCSPNVASRAPMTAFRQPLWRGEDPRVSFRNGSYYTMFNRGTERVLYKSKSLVDRGAGKVVPPNFPLFAPIYIDTLNGVAYNRWFAFDNNVWECDCADPYDNIDQWHLVKALPLTGWSIDFEVFKNPQTGPFQGHWYMAWAGADSPSTGWGFESLFIAEILDLRAGMPTLSTFDNKDANRVAKYRFDWTDVVVEAPGVAVHDQSVSLVYSGNGAQTSDYGLGLVLLKPGSDPAQPASWIDHNAGQCDGDVKQAAEFARTADVWGPGVARFFKSSDGTQDWMMHHTKVWDTFNRGAGTQGQQSNNQMWTRQMQLKPFTWRQVTCSGNAYSIPDMGAPASPNSLLPLPSGDPGVAPLQSPVRVEAETMIPYGAVMGPTMQASVVPSTDLITPTDAACSAGAKITKLDLLAADSTTTPKRSGLRWYNAPAARSLRVATSSAAAANLDLLVDGRLVQTLSFPASAGFVTTRFDVAIPLGATVELAYVDGKSAVADLDYLEFVP